MDSITEEELAYVAAAEAKQLRDYQKAQAARRGLFSCHDCQFCGQSQADHIRCEHPSWDEETSLRYIEPGFARECSDFKKAQDDSEILRVKIGTSDTMAEPTAMVRLPIASMMAVAKILRQSLTFLVLSLNESDEDVQRAYDLAVWIDILEGTVRLHAESVKEAAFDVYGGL